MNLHEIFFLETATQFIRLTGLTTPIKDTQKLIVTKLLKILQHFMDLDDSLHFL